MYVENVQTMHMTYVLTNVIQLFNFIGILSVIIAQLYRLTKKEDVPKSGTPSHLFI